MLHLDPAAQSALETRVADFALRLIAAHSLSGEEQAVADLVAAEMESLGLQVEIDDLGNVTGTLDAGPGPCVLLDGHMDTVGVSDPGAWLHDPCGEREGDRVYGRGAMDMKGPLAACIYGVASLKDRLARGRVVVSATICEELVEGPATVHVAERVRPDFAVICEATSLRLARGQRGRAEVRVDVFGKATHSSRPELGVNAAQAMIDAITAVRAIQPPHHDLLGDGILVLTDIKSEPYPGISVVPDHCMATFDRRTLPGETEDDVLEPIRVAIEHALQGAEARWEVAIAQDDFTSYTGARVTAANFAPAWCYDEGERVVGRALKGLQQAGMEPVLAHYAFCTNGSGTAGRLKIPTIGFGPGDETLAHRSDEYILASDLALAARGYAAIVQQLVADA